VTIDYQTRPLPECVGCGTPMRRHRWAVTRGRCARCSTAGEAIRTGHRAARLAKLTETAAAATEDRITRLAAKRAGRESSGERN
jgi:hypothetical protein